MQTYTHAWIGGAVGVILFPNNIAGQIACVAGSILPDVVMIPQFLWDKVNGRQPLKTQSSFLMSLKEIAHSLPIWSILTIVGATILSTYDILFAIGVGGLLHVFIDIITHGTGPKENRPYWDTDVKFMWPTRTDLRPLGLWEYRYGHGVLAPKPFEFFVLSLRDAPFLSYFYAITEMNSLST
jgi:membrane-bound metal-dependent hydrolase YbcI (DUF457 family)